MLKQCTQQQFYDIAKLIEKYEPYNIFPAKRGGFEVKLQNLHIKTIEIIHLICNDQFHFEDMNEQQENSTAAVVPQQPGQGTATGFDGASATKPLFTTQPPNNLEDCQR